MKIIKPLTLATLQKPYQFGGRNYLVVAALGFFKLGAGNSRFLTENLQWPVVLAALPKGQALDEVMPKRQAEALLLGHAYAPGGQPCQQVTVRMCLSSADGRPSIDKCLRVSGERSGSQRWFTSQKTNSAKPFSRMPLDFAHTYGGPGYATNPAGIGYRGTRLRTLFAKTAAYMPNIEYASDLSGPARPSPRPAGFGPYSSGALPRKSKFGTYDASWLRQDAPGFARDIDWSVFNLAAPDQWAAGFFKGGEQYCLHNVHPKKPQIKGQLPTLRARAFFLLEGQMPSEAKEIALSMDTVWFIPEHELGVLVYHGQVEIGDSDALDVASLMVAYECADQPKTLEHYRQVMALRLAPATAALHVFNEAQLAAQLPQAEQELRAATQHAAEQIDLAKRQRQLDLLDAELWRAQGASAPAGHVAARATPSAFGLVSSAQVAQGDFDLSGVLDKARNMASAAKAQAAAARSQLELEVPPTQALPQTLAEAIERAALPAYDLLDAAETGCDPHTALLLSVLPVPPANASVAELEKYRQARLAILQAPAARRQARRAAPQVTPTYLPLTPEVAAQLGQLVLQWHNSGICLAGRDLAGIDLSGADLSGVDLRQVMLEGADLRGTKFTGSNLEGAVLCASKLDAADFCDANLAGANLCLSTGAAIRLQNATLSRAMASAASWPKADLRGANLDDLLAPKIDLSGAVLCMASARRALLLEAVAEHSDWQGACLEKTVFLRAQLAHANFTAAQLTKTVLIEAQLQESRWNNAHWDAVQATGKTDFSRASLIGVRAGLCGLHGARLDAADLRGAHFLRCDFGLCSMQNARLDGALFSYSIFMQTDLRYSSTDGADFLHAILRKTNFCGATLGSASFAQCELSEMIWPDGKTDRNRRAA